MLTCRYNSRIKALKFTVIGGIHKDASVSQRTYRTVPIEANEATPNVYQRADILAIES